MEYPVDSGSSTPSLYSSHSDALDTPDTNWSLLFGECGNTPLDLLDDKSYILVVGGLGYIGSHTVLELLKASYNVAIIDDLSNSYHGVLDRIKILAKEY